MKSFQEQLERQLGFLLRSCASYDAGFEDEAIRVAAVLRVMFHSTKNQTALVRHLGSESVPLLDTIVPPMPIGPWTRYFDGIGVSTLGADPSYRAPLGEVPVTRFVPLPDWWGAEIFVSGDLRVRRSDLILTAANKDGGAHVDEKLTPEYEALAREGAAGMFVVTSAGGVVVLPTRHVHLTGLRQLGYEVCNSPELFALAAGEARG